MTIEGLVDLGRIPIISVIEASNQDLYVDRPGPIYRFQGNHYRKVGIKKAFPLRPCKVLLREDRTVNPNDLRLEQVICFVNRATGIRTRWEKACMHARRRTIWVKERLETLRKQRKELYSFSRRNILCEG